MRISPNARRLAARARARGVDALDELLDDELGDGLFSTLGGIAGTAIFPGVGTVLGSAIGGLLDGSGSSDTPPPAPAGPSAATLAAILGGGGGPVDELPPVDAARVAAATRAAVPTLDAVRSVVRDALASDRVVNGQADLDAATRERVTRAAAQRIVTTIDPTTRKVRGALAVQRLQRQAGDEHSRAKARADAARTTTTRHQELLAALERAERAFK